MPYLTQWAMGIKEAINKKQSEKKILEKVQEVNSKEHSCSF